MIAMGDGPGKVLFVGSECFGQQVAGWFEFAETSEHCREIRLARAILGWPGGKFFSSEASALVRRSRAGFELAEIFEYRREIRLAECDGGMAWGKVFLVGSECFGEQVAGGFEFAEILAPLRDWIG